MQSHKINSIEIIHRLVAASFGGYLFTWGVSSFFISLLVVIGVAYDQAELGVLICSVFIYLTAFLWSFAAKHLLAVWCVLGGGCILLTLSAVLLQQFFLGS